MTLIVCAALLSCAALIVFFYKQFPIGIAAHAGLMLLSWGFLFPLGAVTARYYKILPRQNYPTDVNNLFWWHWHRALQIAATVIATAALVAVAAETSTGFATWHGRLGIAVMVVAWVQVISGFARGSRGGPPANGSLASNPAEWRGDHYDMTRRRVLFEAWHKPAGWVVLIVAALVVLLGLDLIAAPDWLVATVGGVQAAALIAVIDGRLRKRWVSTYQALWGPDPIHPGNRRETDDEGPVGRPCPSEDGRRGRDVFRVD